jgi:endoglucanase
MKRRTLLQYMGAATTVALGSGLGARNAFGASISLAEELQTPPTAVLEGIYFNQLGYQPGRAKVASLAGKGIEESFRVRSAETGTVVLDGKLGAPTVDAASGDTVRLADLSAVKTAGMYRIEVGGAVSDPFPVRQDVYAGALRSAMRAFYGQRCGCAVDLGNGYRHAACHTDGAYHASSGKTGKAPSNGGWHDAGDYGRYVVNSGITCGTLLWAWEMYPDALHRLALVLPESGKGTPDYLAEVRWNLEWMLSLQDADGGVFHKQTSEHFCGFVMPEKDTLTSYVIGTGQQPYKSTCATADLAAVMAIAARCYKPFDARFARRCLDAARKGYAWAAAHSEVVFTNPADISTGEYGDTSCADELLWAAAELWRTTGDAAFEQAFLTALPKALPAPRHDEAAATPAYASTDLGIDAPSWSNVRSLGCWSYAMAEQKGSAAGAAAKQEIIKATVAQAEQLSARATTSGYGNTLAQHDYIWGSNAVAANQSLMLLVADRISGGHKYIETALNNLHYLVGRNCLGVSWVTQVGTRPVLHPHHRPSIADGIDKPWPGLLSGGPNSHHEDPVADKLPQRPPMRMWVDDAEAYSLTEVAINWNAPLVFLLAAANAPRS